MMLLRRSKKLSSTGGLLAATFRNYKQEVFGNNVVTISSAKNYSAVAARHIIAGRRNFPHLQRVSVQRHYESYASNIYRSQIFATITHNRLPKVVVVEEKTTTTSAVVGPPSQSRSYHTTNLHSKQTQQQLHPLTSCSSLDASKCTCYRLSHRFKSEGFVQQLVIVVAASTRTLVPNKSIKQVDQDCYCLHSNHNKHTRTLCDRHDKYSTILRPTSLHINNLLKHPLVRRGSQMAGSLSGFVSRLMSTLASTQRGYGSRSGSGIPIENGEQEDSLADQPKANKRIKINACGELYKELAKIKPSLYSGAPKGKGIDFDCRYYDNMDVLELPASAKLRAPIACLLHGAPGHYNDFTKLINYLTVKGIRVIAPVFPDYSATLEHSFRHSPPERLEYLLKFFEALSIKKIDILIGHSSAIYTVFELMNHTLTLLTTKTKKVVLPGTPQPIQIKSLGLFSTPTYNLPPNLAVTPLRLFTLKLFEYPLIRPIISALIHTFVKLQGIRNKVDKNNIEKLLIAASAVGYSESEKMVERLKLVKNYKVPTFVLIGCQDKLIPMRCFEQLKSDLGVYSERQIKQYNDDGILVKDVDEFNELVEVSEFSSGGHYTFQKFSQQVNEDIYNFLKRKVLNSNFSNESTKL